VEKALVIAAHIADRIVSCPEALERDYRKQLLVKKILSIFQTNKVELVYLPRRQYYSWFFDSEEYKRALRKELTILNKRKAEYKRIKEAFSERGIPLILFKSCGEFNYLGSDYDVLIKSEHVNHVGNIFNSMGYKIYHQGSEPYKKAFIKIADDFEKYIVECYEGLVWYSKFGDHEELFRNSTPSPIDPMIDILSNEDRVLAFFSHSLYQEKCFTLSDVVDIRRSISTGLNFDYIFRIASDRGWLGGIYAGIYIVSEIEKRLFSQSVFPEDIRSLVSKKIDGRGKRLMERNPPTAMPYCLPPLKMKFEHAKKIFIDKKEAVKGKIKSLFQLAWKMVMGRIARQDKGFIVAISGLDGSGKSTLAADLKRAFSELTEISREPSIVWTRIDGHRLSEITYRCAKLLGKRRFTEFNDFEKTKILKSNILFRKLWLAMNLSGVILKLFLKVKIPSLLLRVVICDRYYYDAIADMVVLLQGNFNLVKRLLCFLCPKPDVALYLKVDPSVAFKRLASEDRKFRPIDIMMKRALIYDRIFQENIANTIYILDGSLPLKRLESKAIKVVLTEYYGKERSKWWLWRES